MRDISALEGGEKGGICSFNNLANFLKRNKRMAVEKEKGCMSIFKVKKMVYIKSGCGISICLGMDPHKGVSWNCRGAHIASETPWCIITRGTADKFWSFQIYSALAVAGAWWETLRHN